MFPLYFQMLIGVGGGEENDSLLLNLIPYLTVTTARASSFWRLWGRSVPCLFPSLLETHAGLWFGTAPLKCLSLWPRGLLPCLWLCVAVCLSLSSPVLKGRQPLASEPTLNPGWFRLETFHDLCKYLISKKGLVLRFQVDLDFRSSLFHPL